MNGILADTYPTRYVAFENPKSWVEAKDFSVRRGGYEYAAYIEPMQNTEYPHLTDGIYCQIVSYQGIDFMADCHYTIPNKERKQGDFVKRFTDYHEARKAVQNWIPQARDIITEALKAEALA